MLCPVIADFYCFLYRKYKELTQFGAFRNVI